MQEQKPVAASASINFRLPGDLKARLSERARADDRTLNSMVVHIIRQHLRHLPPAA